MSERLSAGQFAAIAKALAEPRRYGILREVAAAASPLPCCTLLDATKVSAATISHHISELEAAGLIDIAREGKFAILGFRRDVFEAYLRQLTESLTPSL